MTRIRGSLVPTLLFAPLILIWFIALRLRLLLLTKLLSDHEIPKGEAQDGDAGDSSHDATNYKPEGEDTAEAALFEAEFVEDAAFEDAAVDDVGADPPVTIVEVGLVVTTFPFTTHLPSFLLQQFGPFSRVGLPQQRLPSAQVVNGIHTHTQIEAGWVRPCPIRAGVTENRAVIRGNTKAVATAFIRVLGCNVSD
ncbi:MAG: hypothetical protein Q9195_000097 [Heterodermia aff. obscurata]